jgi:hypothetical protein
MDEKSEMCATRAKGECDGCALWAQCRPPDGKDDSHRTVFISDYHHQLRAAVTFNASTEGQVLLATRWRVEPVVSWLVQYQGCRQARRVGQTAAQFHQQPPAPVIGQQLEQV